MKSKVILLVATILVCRLHAADETKPLRRPADAAIRPGLAQGGAGNGLVTFERVLTDEQRQKMRELMQEKGGDLRQNAQRVVQLRRELNEAVFAGKADEKLIKEKADEIAKLDAEQLRARMTALSKIAATFTPEQREKVKEMGEQMRAARPGLGAGARDGEFPRKVAAGCATAAREMICD